MAEPDSTEPSQATRDPSGPLKAAADPVKPTDDIVLQSAEPKLALASAPGVPAAPTAATADAIAFTPDPAAAQPVPGPVAPPPAAQDTTEPPKLAPVREAPASGEARAASVPPAGSAGRVAASAAASPLAAYEALARSARLADLVALTAGVVGEAARVRPSDWSLGPKVVAAANEAKLSRDDATTAFGNVLDVLGTGGTTEPERALASALWAHVVAETPRKRTEDEDRLAGDILWLATHSTFDATPLLERALGEEAGDLWSAIAIRIRRIDRGSGGALGRPEAIFGCAAIALAGSARARTLAAGLATDLRDPILQRILGAGGGAAPTAEVTGEMLPTPRGYVATALLACSGLLFAIHAVRLALRLALAYRRPTEVSFGASEVRVKTRTELLGRVLTEREHVIPKTGLVRVVREVRYPRAAFYAGLLALALGSYVGVRAFVDGVRAASPSLLLVGLVIIGIGIGADFVLGTLLPGSRSQCRIALVPRAGRVLCVGGVDIGAADTAVRAMRG